MVDNLKLSETSKKFKSFSNHDGQLETLDFTANIPWKILDFTAKNTLENPGFPPHLLNGHTVYVNLLYTDLKCPSMVSPQTPKPKFRPYILEPSCSCMI